MPAISYYPDNPYLFEVLMETYYGVSNRDIFSRYLLDQLERIVKDYRAGKNPYACRARFRQWRDEWFYPPGEFTLYDAPTWEKVITPEWWTHNADLGFYDDGTYEWALFSADLDCAYEEVKARGLDIEGGDLAMALAKHNDTVILHEPGDGFYVVKSPFLENFGPNKYNPFDGFETTVAGSDGNIPSYAMDISLIEMAADLEEENEKWPGSDPGPSGRGAL